MHCRSFSVLTLLSVSRTREVSLKRVLEHELAAVPPSLFNDDGQLEKQLNQTWQNNLKVKSKTTKIPS